jgi:hypothetical protein
LDASKLFKFFRQSMTKRAFCSQLIKKLLGSIEGGRLDRAAVKKAAPTAGDLLLS